MLNSPANIIGREEYPRMHATCRYDLYNTYLQLTVHQSTIQSNDKTPDTCICECRYKHTLKLVFLLGTQYTK